MSSAVSGINGALDYLRADPNRVQPQLGKTSYFGFSFGGIITANLANRWRSLGLPKPRAIFLEDPHDGGLVGFDEPALDDSMAGIPKGVKLECHSSADGVTGEPEKANSSCNALFPMLGQIPNRNKDLVMIRPDDHGEPPLTAPPRRLRKSAGHGRRLRLELLLEGLGRATRLRLLRHSPSLRARRHPSPSVERQVERRDPDQAAEGPEHRADSGLSCTSIRATQRATGVGSGFLMPSRPGFPPGPSQFPHRSCAKLSAAPMIPAADILNSLNLLGAMIWTGGMVAVTVATIAARQTLEPKQQVSFFAALGRRYGIVSGAALAIFIVSGLVIAGDPADWTGTETAIAALTAAAAALTVLGVINARAVQRLRSQAIAAGDRDSDSRLRNTRRTATVLRVLIALVTLAAVLVATI